MLNTVTPTIHLIGWTNAGKSAFGAQLARELDWCFINLDDAIAQRAGMAVAQIMVEQGPCLLRALEGETLHALCLDGRPKVLATGDAALLRTPNRQRLVESGLVVWLDAGNPTPSYQPWADLHLAVNRRSQDEMLAAIMAALD